MLIISGPLCEEGGKDEGERGAALSFPPSSPSGREMIFTVGEAVRSTCGNPHEKENEENEEERFHLSHPQTILCPYSKYGHKKPTGVPRN